MTLTTSDKDDHDVGSDMIWSVWSDTFHASISLTMMIMFMLLDAHKLCTEEAMVVAAEEVSQERVDSPPFPLSLHNIKYNLFTSRLLHRVPVLCLLLMGKGQKPHLHRITIIIIIPTHSKVLLLTWYTVYLQFSFYTMLANIHIIFSSSSKKWSICPFYLSLFAHTH